MNAAARLDAIYARLPRLECQGHCQDSCGPIPVGQAELDRIAKHIGGKPASHTSLTCPVLDETSGRCRAHAVRPLICRLFGMVHRMTCVHGCKPERWVSDEEADALLRDVLRLGPTTLDLMPADIVARAAGHFLDRRSDRRSDRRREPQQRRGPDS